MEWGKQMEKHQENAKLSLYQNTNYTFERNERKTLIVDYKIFEIITDINLPLYEPLIIDKLSDIYLDSFTTFNAIVNNNTEKAAFVLSINEFNVKNNSNKYNTETTPTRSFRNIIIPNEDGVGGNTTQVHKGKKMNYICSINPTKLSSLTIKITDLNSTPASMFGAAGRFIAEFIIVARDKE